MTKATTRTFRLVWGVLGAVFGVLLVLAQLELGLSEDRELNGSAERAALVAGALSGGLADHEATDLPGAALRTVQATLSGIVAADDRIIALRVWSPIGELVVASDPPPTGEASAAQFADAVGGHPTSVVTPDERSIRTLVPLPSAVGPVSVVVEVWEANADPAHRWGALRTAFASLLVIALVGFATTFLRRPPADASAGAVGGQVAEPAIRAPFTRGGAPNRLGEDTGAGGEEEDDMSMPLGGSTADESAYLGAALERARAAERRAEDRVRSAEIELGILREERQTEPAVRVRELQEALRRSETEAAQMAERLRWIAAGEEDDATGSALREALRRSEAE